MSNVPSVTRAPELLAELAESDAPPSVRAVYAGLRAGTVSPIAALIWRHIATHPGVLEACWAALNPVFENGQVPQIAWRVARENASEELLPRIEPCARIALGIAPEQAATIQAVIEAYNRANPVNLLAVLTLLSRIESDAPARPVQSVPHTPPLTIEHPLPDMTPPAQMSTDLRWLLNDLRFGDRSKLDAIVPSLYRHLTDWPAYLGALHVVLAPRFRDGSMAIAVQRVEQAMAVEAKALARQIAPIPELAGEPALHDTMRRFASGFIPTMIVVGRGMAGQLR